MIIHDPCRWVADRSRKRQGGFAVRLNDGEFALMFGTRREGEELGTEENKCHVRREEGDSLLTMVSQMALADPADTLVGCSWWHDREHVDTQRFRKLAEMLGVLDSWNWCHEHWPLEGVVTGGTREMLEGLPSHVCLVTCSAIKGAAKCIGAGVIEVPTHDAWYDRRRVKELARWLLQGFPRTTFVWAAGCGMKPIAWDLYREFPQSLHVDVGHLFNGAMGLKDYGWLDRGDGLWYEPYFRPGGFSDWVRRHIK